MKISESSSKPVASVVPQEQLFRNQAVLHAGIRQYGTVILARSLSHFILATLAIAIAVSIISFFVFFSTTRKAQSQGVLLPTAGVIRVLAGQGGIVQKINVSEGKFVHTGDVLFALSGERSTITEDSPEKKVTALLRRRQQSFDVELAPSSVQSSQRITAAQRKVLDIKSEIDRMDIQMASQRKRMAISEKAYERFTSLYATNYISVAQLQDKQGEVLDQQQRLAELQRIKSSSERELANAEAEVRDIRVQAARDTVTLQRSLSTVEQDLTENEARRIVLVRAQQDGMVTAIQTAIGQTVTSNSTLSSLLPAGAELEVEIYAPSRSTGFIRPGMTVLLRFQAYPYQKFGQYRAQVREIANMSQRSEDIAQLGILPNSGVTEPLYRIRLKLDQQTVIAYGKPMPLKAGMLVDATILLEHRRLYEWILEPLFSLSGRI